MPFDFHTFKFFLWPLAPQMAAWKADVPENAAERTVSPCRAEADSRPGTQTAEFLQHFEISSFV